MKYLVTASLLLLSFTVCSQSKIVVNEQRLQKRIFELSQFGKDSSGRGYRVAYTKGDQEGRAYLLT